MDKYGENIKTDFKSYLVFVVNMKPDNNLSSL